MVFAALAILAYLLRLSGIINFISETVLVGFKAGAALTIGLTQLPKLFGVNGGGENFLERIIVLIQQLPETNTAVLIFGIAAIAILIFGEKMAPGKPVAIIICNHFHFLITTTSLGLQGFSTVGIIPSGLPEFHFPSLRFRDIDDVFPLAMACFLLSYIESVSAARSLAHKKTVILLTHVKNYWHLELQCGRCLGPGLSCCGWLSLTAVNDTVGKNTFVIVSPWR